MRVVSMCYVVCDGCTESSPAEQTKKDAIWVARQVGWKTIKGETLCVDCQTKQKEVNHG